jgi:methionyl-tRNA formyltransferase
MLAEEGAALLVETLPGWLAKKIKAKAQDESQVTVTSLLKKEDGAIDWNLPAVDIGRRVRAYNPWPGAFTHLEDALLNIWETRDAPGESNAKPGTIIELSAESGRKRGSFAVQTGEGVLIPITVQREGRKRVSAAEFLRGAPDIVGRRLG